MLRRNHLCYDFKRNQKENQGIEKEALEAVEKEGVTIIRPVKTLFSEKVTTIYDEYKNDPVIYKLIQQIKETN